MEAPTAIDRGGSSPKDEWRLDTGDEWRGGSSPEDEWRLDTGDEWRGRSSSPVVYLLLSLHFTKKMTGSLFSSFLVVFFSFASATPTFDAGVSDGRSFFQKVGTLYQTGQSSSSFLSFSFC